MQKLKFIYKLLLHNDFFQQNNNFNPKNIFFAEKYKILENYKFLL